MRGYGEIYESYKVVLKKHGGRLTRERLLILQAVCNTEGHFQPEDLELRMRATGQPISLTTIYRNMPLLVEAGILRRTCLSEDPGGGVHYENIWGHEHHDHLICSACGLKVEFFYPAIDVLQEEVARSHGFILQRHHLELIGQCPRCQQTS